MFLKPRGSVTVFICIILAVIIPLSCIMIDLARIAWAKGQAKAALKICTESMLAAYDRQLKEQYGLFSIYPQSNEAMEKEIYELMCQNLNVNSSVDGVSDVYGFKVKSVKAIPLYNYSEPFVLQQQISEFMKYRAPVSAVQELYEKIKVMTGLIKEGDMVEQKITVDKLMYSIRGNLVNISGMINGVIKEFNPVHKSTKLTLKETRLSNAKSHISIAESHVKDANSHVVAIKEAKTGYNGIYDSYISSKKTYENLLSEKNSINNKLINKKEKLANKKGDKKALEADIEVLEAEYKAISSSCNTAYSIYSSYGDRINVYKSDFDNGIDSAIASLAEAIISNNNVIYEMDSFKHHISQYITYHEDVLQIIDQIVPELGELNKKVNDLKSDATKNEGAISTSVSADLDKQIKSIEVGSFDTVKSQLSSNLHTLKAWGELFDHSLGVLNQCAASLNQALKTAENVKASIHNDKIEFEGYYGYGIIDAEITELDRLLIDLKAINQMTGIYIVPDYMLEPKANDIEKDAFKKWFASNYGIENSQAPVEKDDTDLKNVRQGAEALANSAAYKGKNKNDEYEGINDIKESIDKRFRLLPSVKGISHSNEAIKKIGGSINASPNIPTINNNPFEDPVKGLSDINEEKKSFFDFEIERVVNFLKIINDLMLKNQEDLFKSLYMNEYIVSAFKCETSKNGIDHDIGWDRPLEKSFFKQAEVEYILFGEKTVEANVNATKRSLFAARLLFNLIHVYSSADKVAVALSLATAIAGWTLFGIPIVQNFIIVAWAAAESYLDVDLLMKGQSVPLIKTECSWQLGVQGLNNKLMELLTNGAKNYAKDVVNNTINQTSEAIEETISGIINGYIDQAFAPFEEDLNQLPNEVDKSILNDVNDLLKNVKDDFLNGINFDNIDGFKSSLKMSTTNLINTIPMKLKSYSQANLFNFKATLKEEIRKLIFGSSGYRKLEENLKKLCNDLVDEGVAEAQDAIESTFGADDISGKNNIYGRLIMFDYVDYLRLFLLAVPAEIKALRTADLIQLNIQQLASEYELTIDRYNTYLFIQVELDINTWIIPENILRKNNSGMITIEWCQGY